MARGDFVKRSIAAIYSKTADRFYEPVVVRRAFPLLGGDLNDLVLEQGRRAVAFADGRPILDMPVGTAYFTRAMAMAHDGIVVGSDIAEGMVRQAQRAARTAGTTNLVPVQADAHHLPFADRSFAAILCTNGLQVIPDLRASVVELSRVLAPDGRLFVSVVTLPVGAVLPARAAERLPTLMKSESDIERALNDDDMTVVDVRKNRLAVLLEAVKGARTL